MPTTYAPQINYWIFLHSCWWIHCISLHYSTKVSTSSTECELIAAVTAAKAAKYLRAILSDLGFPQSDATVLYEDNASALKIVNAKVPTERSRHIDIQHFAIQEWKDSGQIILRHIPGTINPSNDLTKPLGWVLHSRHCRRLMGHFTPLYSSCPLPIDRRILPKAEGGCHTYNGQTVYSFETDSDLSPFILDRRLS